MKILVGNKWIEMSKQAAVVVAQSVRGHCGAASYDHPYFYGLYKKKEAYEIAEKLNAAQERELDAMRLAGDVCRHCGSPGSGAERTHYRIMYIGEVANALATSDDFNSIACL